MRRCWPALALLLALAPAALRAAPASPAEAPAATLDRTAVPAAGRHSAILTVSKFGRYAITVTSAQGAGLHLVDRMAGPGPIAGTPGERDGRLDVFLDRGEYKVVTEGHRKATGAAQLAVRAFAEKTAERPPMLVELKPVESALDDFEQVSYWLDVKERHTVSLEAAGRSLADLRLWKDGTWLVDAAPAMQVVQPRVGRPLLVCRLAARLDRGLYLLTAYGGAPRPWAEDDGGRPFHLRFGIPRLGEAGRRRFTAGPFGLDRFLVPGDATYFRLELPEPRPASMQVGWFAPEDPFRSDGPTTEISKKSVPPVAETMVEGAPEKDHVVTVTAPEGQPYVLQHFELRTEYTFRRGGEHWISTVHSGHPTDSVDATAIVTRWSPVTTGHAEPFVSQVVDLDAKTGWARRANLLAPLTVFLQVRDAGSYEILAQGTEARFRIEPFLTYRPARYEPPPYRGPGSVWELDAGFYVLTADPVRKGVLDVAIRPKGLVDFVLEKLGLGRGLEGKPVHAAVRFPSVSLDQDLSYTLYLNHQPEVRAGVILRRLPLDLTEPLPVSQQPGDTVSVPFRAEEPGTLRAEAEGGSLLQVSVDGGAWQQAVAVEAGSHTASVRHAGGETVQYALALEPRRLQAQAALPALPDTALEGLPQLPVLAEAAPRALDLGRETAATFLVRADKPALYRLQSTGLLATEGNLRSRTVTSFLREAQNGVGRNFLLQQYLREGDYQLTVAAKGLSAGHLGLTLSRTNILSGGFLTSRIPARISLPAGQAMAYRFTITKPGEFRLRALGLGRGFRCRLEDQDGWPVEAPNIPADVTRYFEPGRYRLVILPEATAARVVTLIEPVPAPRRLAGHGPHRLPLARRIEHVWLEPEAGGERVPDAWDFTVPAPVDATVELTGEMQGNLVRVGGDGSRTPVAFVPPARAWKGALAAGRYRLETACLRVNNRASYQVAVWPEQLLAGLDREVAAPGEVAVSVGRTGLVELSSFGSDDVRARLFDAQGSLVGSSDDRPDDWNFSIARSLTAGTYRLRVDPVGTAAARATVSMRVPREVEKPPLVLSAGPPLGAAHADVSLGRTVHVYPLSVPAQAGLLAAAVRSAESVGVAIEVEAPEGWRSVGSSTGRTARVEVPLGATEVRHRLRLWSLDRRDSPVHLSAAAVASPLSTESQLRPGVALSPVRGLGLGVTGVRLDRPGVFRVEGEAQDLRWCPAPLQACRPAANGYLAATGATLWVVGEAAGDRPSRVAQASRLTLASGPDKGIPLVLPAGAPVTCDLAAPARGPLLIMASSRAGQPGVRVAERGSGETGGREMAVGTRSAVAVALHPQQPVAVLWPASRAEEGLEVRVEQVSLPQPEGERAAYGTWDGAVEGLHARAFTLPAGRKRLHLALGERLVAVLSRGDEVESVHWTGGEAFAETVEAGADRLTLLHTRTGEDRFSVEAIPIADGDATPALGPGASYERAHVRAGAVRLAVSPAGDGPATLHVRGAREEPIFIGAVGHVARGTDLPVDPHGGTLLVRHGPGLLLAWADRPGAEAEDLWSTARAGEAARVEPPASLTLTGPARAFRLEPPSPVVLHLRTAAPVVTLVKRGEAAPEVDVHPRGAVVDAYLPAGRSDLVLRALAGGTLSGLAEITTTAVTPIGEGLGPEVLLAPGATRLFSFAVEREGPVGIGVRASSDVVETTLLTGAGRRLGEGVVQMPALTPGTYLLALHAPEDGAPVRARAALAGLELPDTGPPEDVVRKYLEPEELAPSFTSRRVVETPWRPEPGEETGIEATGEEGATEEGAEGMEGVPEEGESPDSAEPVDEAPEGRGAGGGA